VLNSSQRSETKWPQFPGAEACTAFAFQPLCQMPRVPSITKYCVSLDGALASSKLARKLVPSSGHCV
jgi:hypothetical protein